MEKPEDYDHFINNFIINGIGESSDQSTMEISINLLIR